MRNGQDGIGATTAAEILIAALRELSEVKTLRQVTRIVRHTARQLATADGATFVLREGQQCHYVDEEAIGPLWKGRRFPMAACISGWAMQHRQQVVVPDVYADDRIPHDAYRATFVRSLVMTPVRMLRPQAAIGVYWATPHEVAPHEAGWLQALADATAVALENVRVLAELAAHERSARDTRPNESVRMCAWTRRLFLDGEWVSLEEFLDRRFGLAVTHSISDDALAIVEEAVAELPDPDKPVRG